MKNSVVKRENVRCSVPDCTRFATGKSKAMCSAHYQRVKDGVALDKPLRTVDCTKLCSIEGCGYVARLRGMCTGHAQRVRHKGDPLAHIPLRRSVTYLECQEEGCTKEPSGYGFCSTHYKLKKSRDELPSSRFTNPRCEVEGCEKPLYSKGMCQGHSRRVRVKSTLGPDIPLKAKAPKGTGYQLPTGYVMVYDKTHPNSNSHGAIYQHRYLVSSQLGRPLVKGEEVHHRNGIRNENTVGPCLTKPSCDCVGTYHNLELWSKSQPSGQRIADKVRWAKEILALYDTPPKEGK